MEETDANISTDVEDLYQEILEFASSSVEATPIIALQPLFECVIGAGSHIVECEDQKTPLLKSVQKIIDTLLAVLSEEASSSTIWTNMLNKLCQLIFTGNLLLLEYQQSYANDNGPMPVMKTFEILLMIGGNTIPHIF